MESDEDKKKLNDDLVDFMSKRTGGADTSRYVTRLRSYVDLQHKRQRAGAARRFYQSQKDSAPPRKKAEGDAKDNTIESTDRLENEEGAERKRNSGDNNSRSEGACDRCGRRRRRRRSCPRRRKRRRSCKRRRRRRRRRRSCSRRRRRRSCRRRRRCRRRKRC